MIIAVHESASRNSSRVRRIQNSKRGAISVSRCSQCGLRPVEILIYTDELHMFPFRHYTSTYPFSKSLCENDVIIALPQTRIVCMQIEKILASFSAIISSLLLISPRDRSREKEKRNKRIRTIGWERKGRASGIRADNYLSLFSTLRHPLLYLSLALVAVDKLLGKTRYAVGL